MQSRRYDDRNTSGPPLDSADVLRRTPLASGRSPARREMGSVSFGRPVAYWAPPGDRPDGAGSGGDELGLWAAFDLRPPTASTRFAAVFLQMRFDDSRVVAVSLDAAGHPGAPPSWEERLRYGGPVSGSGIGESSFGWFFGDFAARAPLPWRHAVHAVVRVPRDVPEVTGTVRADVSMVRRGHRARLLHARSGEAPAFALALPPGRPAPPASSWDGSAAGDAHASSGVRLCLAADIEKFSRFHNPEAARAQRRFVEVLEAARRHAGVTEDDVERQQAGDGQLAILPAAIDESRVIPLLVEGLRSALADVNRDLNARARIRIRVALHRGHVVPGVNGWIGDSTIAVHRLLDSAPARRALAGSPDADFVLIVPDTLYRDIIAHGYGHLAPDEFEPVEAVLPDKDFAERAWVHAPRAR
ncbi:hypothetical protein [Actinomadura sp. GTD37]|uniref:hypothetical protein n=1 Tax=Actinomadura sp. GTD37 TaxID=1778030 RepID=UPI0035BFC346